MSILFNEAYTLASIFHNGQYRKNSGIHYIIHPLQVCDKLTQWGLTKENNENLLCAAMLHDVLEDTVCPPEKLKFFTNGEILNIVEELTYRGRDRVDKEKYMNSFATSSIEALIIKVADRLCNVQDYLNFDETYIYAKKYFWKAERIFDAVDKRQSEIITKSPGIYANMIASIMVMKGIIDKI